MSKQGPILQSWDFNMRLQGLATFQPMAAGAAEVFIVWFAGFHWGDDRTQLP